MVRVSGFPSRSNSWRLRAPTSHASTGANGKAADERAREIATAMRLSPRHLDMRPRQLSGGLKQRVAIARAFAGAT